MIIDKNKTYRTRDGREVRIYATDCGGHYPIHGATKEQDNRWAPRTWAENGLFDIDITSHSLDLIEADPHGILPRHREVYAVALEKVACTSTAETVRNGIFERMPAAIYAALIALARLDAERSKEEG